jgi:hypothetical protein
MEMRRGATLETIPGCISTVAPRRRLFCVVYRGLKATATITRSLRDLLKPDGCGQDDNDVEILGGPANDGDMDPCAQPVLPLEAADLHLIFRRG